MSAIIFDGRAVAFERERRLRKRIKLLRREGIVLPKLVVVSDGGDVNSRVYVDLKKKCGERGGVDVEVKEFSRGVTREELVDEIRNANVDELVHGVMAQLPLPDYLCGRQRGILNAIVDNKDVDGLRRGG